MNELFHEFTPGFNWWYIVAPVMLVSAWLIGLRVPHRYWKENGAIGIYMNPRIGNVLSVVYSLILGLLFMLESGLGMLQYAFNGLERYENPFWAYIFSGLGLAFLILVMYSACFFSFGLGQNSKKKHLIRKYRLTKRPETEEDEEQSPYLRVVSSSEFSNDTPSGRAARH